MLLYLCTGRLMCTETLRVMHPHGSEYRPALVNPKQCYWKEMPTSRKTVVLCLRVYILINQQQEETESIGTHTLLIRDNRILLNDLHRDVHVGYNTMQYYLVLVTIMIICLFLRHTLNTGTFLI